MTRLSLFDLCVNEHYSLNILNELNALHPYVNKSRAIGEKFINKLILIEKLEKSNWAGLKKKQLKLWV